MSRVMKVALVAGQECLLSTHGTIHISLLDGVVEVAGVLLQPNTELVVNLSSSSNRRLSAYSFEGGTVSITSSGGSVDVVKYSTDAGSLMSFTRSTLTPLRTSRVAVVGVAGAGKTLVAHSICNMLARGQAGVFLADLSPASNSVLCPGCISAAHVSSTHPLVVGDCAAPEEIGLSFFCGSTRPVKLIQPFVHQLLQLQECLQSLVKQMVAPREATHIIYDVGAPDDSVPLDAYLRRVLEVIRPTHVVVVTNKKADTAAGRLGGTSLWYSNLQEDVQRLLQDCEFRVLQQVPHHVIAAGGADVASSPIRTNLPQQQQQLVEEYFAGTVNRPLGTTKVVLKLSSLRFYLLVPPATATGSPSTQRITPTEADVALTVCAISHAAVEAEIPFANICGLMLVVSVDQVHDELIVILPSGECEVPKPFVLVPEAGSGKVKLTPPIVSSYS